MASESSHAALVVHNVDLIVILYSQNGFHDWITIAAFYTAVHAVEMIFALEGFHSSDHMRREYRLKTDRRYEQIYRHYSALVGPSLIARYLTGPERFAAFMSFADVHSIVVRHHLLSILQSAKKKLRDSATQKQVAEALAKLGELRMTA